MSVAISLLWSDWFFMLLLSRSGCVSSSSELAARHGSLNLIKICSERKNETKTRGEMNVKKKRKSKRKDR